MTDLNKNILIIPNLGKEDDPIITFTGQNANPITLRVLDSAISFEGTVNSDLLKINDISTNVLEIKGSFSHEGLNPTTGTNLDQVKIITKSLVLTTNWQDTGIQSTDLETGTYILQFYANDANVGGINSNEYYSGILSWYSSTTYADSNLPTDELILHRAGASRSNYEIYLRTYRLDNQYLKLQISVNTDRDPEMAEPSNYVFKFRRIL